MATYQEIECQLTLEEALQWPWVDNDKYLNIKVSIPRPSRGILTLLENPDIAV